MASTQTQPTTLRGVHVLVGILLFFGVIFAVNGVFLVSALRTHTGIVSQQPYRKGLDYNQRIAAEKRQQSLGWQHALEAGSDGRRLRLSVTDRNSQAVSMLAVTGFIGRPSTVRYDQPLTLTETTTPGLYEAELSNLSSGNWIVELKASRNAGDGTNEIYRLRKRLWLKR